MADKQISELTAVSLLGDSDLFVVQQSGTAKKATGSNVGSYISGKHYWRFPKVQKLATDTLVAIDPCKYYTFPEMQLLTISFSATDPDVANAREFRFRFSSGNTPTVLNLPASVHGILVPKANKTYDVTIYDNYMTYTEYDDAGWEAIQYMVRNGTIGNVYSVGDTISCPYRDGTITWKIIGIDEETPSNAARTHSLTLQMVEGISEIPFWAPEAIYYASAELAAGSYKMEINEVMYYFTLTDPVPEGGQVYVHSWSSSGGPTWIKTFADCYSSTPINTVASSSTEISGATELTTLNNTSRARYGYHEWANSTVRKWLNSTAEAGHVFTPANNYDRIPDYLASGDNAKGFLNGFNDDFLDVIGKVQKVTRDPGGSAITSGELVFLPSMKELYGGNNGNVSEGTAYSYYEDNSSLLSPGTSADTNRITSIGGSPVYWWTRSLQNGETYNREYYVHQDGRIVAAAPYNKFAIFPVVCIV